MELINKYSVFIGTTRGTLCYTNLDNKSKIKYEFAKEPSEIGSMIWGAKDDEIYAGFKDGTISIYNATHQKYITEILDLKDQGSIVGLGSIGDRVIATSAKGKISILHSKTEIDNIMTISSDNATMECSTQNQNKLSVIATGGEMNDLKLWDIETKQCIFRAKSLGHDQLNLPIRTSVRGIAFIPDEQNVCCCVTKEGHVLIYDDRTQRRPVCKFFEQKASYTTITTSFKQRNILAGTTKGYIQYLDMKTGKCQKTFTGIGGSVTSLLCDPIEPILFAASLDRYLRIFNVDTKEVLYKQYLKQNLTKLLMKPKVKEEIQEEPSNSLPAEDDEYEEIFSNMEVITEKPAKKRNLINETIMKNKKIKC